MGTGRAGVAPGMAVVDRGPGAGAKHGVLTPAGGTVVCETQRQRGRKAQGAAVSRSPRVVQVLVWEAAARPPSLPPRLATLRSKHLSVGHKLQRSKARAGWAQNLRGVEGYTSDSHTSTQPTPRHLVWWPGHSLHLQEAQEACGRRNSGAAPCALSQAQWP